MIRNELRKKKHRFAMFLPFLRIAVNAPRVSKKITLAIASQLSKVFKIILTIKNNIMIIKNPGSTTFWIDPIKNPLAFKDGNNIHWISFELNEVIVEVTSEGSMFLLEINKGTLESVCIFKRDINFQLDKKTFIAITWSNEQVRLYIDAKLEEEISIIDI